MSRYAFMSADAFDAADWNRGYRLSLDGSQVVAKLAPGQDAPEGASVQTYEQTLVILAGPEWSPAEPE